MKKEYFVVDSEGDVLLDFEVDEKVLEKIKEFILDILD